MELTNYVALSYLTAKQRSLDVTADNLANAGTLGFKAERVQFSDWLGKQTGTDGSRGTKPVAFVQDRATYREKAEGAVQQTGNPLDLAVIGDGYFTIDTARGQRLTRAGRFAPQADGTIANENGDALLDTGGQKIRLSPADTSITVTADGSLASENGTLGRIAVVIPKEPAKLQGEGNWAMRADAGTTPMPQPHIVQGALEESNVQPILEMTRMMDGLRSFQMTAQLVEQEGQRIQNAIDKLSQQKG